MARKENYDDYEDYEDYTDFSEDEGRGRKFFTPALGQRILRTLIIFVVLLGIFLLLVFQVFVVKDVEVEGNELYEDQVIRDVVLNDEYSWSSILVYLKYRFRDTQKIPFVDTMEVSMAGPQKLKISVYEKGMMGYLYIPGISEYAYFDKDGLVVETSSDIVPGVPEIRGLDCSSVVLYEKLPISDPVLKDLLKVTQSLKRASLVPDAVEYKKSTGLMLIYDKVEVRVGSMDELTQKVERMAKILPTLNNKVGTLHLENWTEDTSDIFFSEKKQKNKKQ